jgi:hypothetical protein
MALSVQSITGFWLGNKEKMSLDDIECTKMNFSKDFDTHNCPGIVISLCFYFKGAFFLNKV